MDYLDLYLIHQQFGDIDGWWRAMQDACIDGKLRAIGVSNVAPDRLMDLIAFNEMALPVNQIVVNPFHQQADSSGFMADYQCRPKHGRRARMEENLAVFDFQLNDADTAAIATLETGTSSFFSHQNPAIVKWMREHHLAI